MEHMKGNERSGAQLGKDFHTLVWII